MAFIYLISSPSGGAGKSYVADKLGLEFPVSGPDDFPPTTRVSELIHRGDNVVFTAVAHGEDIENITTVAMSYAKIAGTKFINVAMAAGPDHGE